MLSWGMPPWLCALVLAFGMPSALGTSARGVDGVCCVLCFAGVSKDVARVKQRTALDRNTLVRVLLLWMLDACYADNAVGWDM